MTRSTRLILAKWLRSAMVTLLVMGESGTFKMQAVLRTLCLEGGPSALQRLQSVARRHQTYAIGQLSVTELLDFDSDGRLVQGAPQSFAAVCRSPGDSVSRCQVPAP
jgi:hypothetical protein